MADQPITTPYQRLATQLREQNTVTDLFKLAASDEFKLAASGLEPADLKRLRDLYNETRADLDGKVKLDTFDGQVVNIVNVEWWHSDGFDADGVTLTIRPEREPDKKYRALTSSMAVVQFANSLKEVPTEKAPVRVMLQLVPVTDTKRAAQGHKKWSIKRLAHVQTRNEQGTPF